MYRYGIFFMYGTKCTFEKIMLCLNKYNMYRYRYDIYTLLYFFGERVITAVKLCQII